MPRSVSLVGLARRGVIPQNNSTRECFFCDPVVLVLNAEYRRELGMPVDLVLFTDWGKVFPKPGALAFSELHGSAGVGFRFKTRSSVVMRMDFGFSPEGVRFWWAFSDIFRGFLHNLY